MIGVESIFTMLDSLRHKDIPKKIQWWTSLPIQLEQVLQNEQVALTVVDSSRRSQARCPEQNVLFWIKA